MMKTPRPGEQALALNLQDALDQLVRTTEVRQPAVADLARRTRYRMFDRPRLERERAVAHTRAHALLIAHLDDRDADRQARNMTELVAMRPSLLPLLLDPAMTGEVMGSMLEVLTRRYYRRQQLDDVRRIGGRGLPAVVARVRDRGGRRRIVAAAGDDLDELLDLGSRLTADRVAEEAGGAALDAYLRWPDAPFERGAIVAALLPRLRATSTPTTLDRVTVTVLTKDEEGTARVQARTFHRRQDTWSERRHLRGLHPAVADRLDLWRFEHCGLTRLASRDEVYLFRAVGREQPHDVRLFALGEVRELTPTVDHLGRVFALPELERVLTACLDDLRDHRSALPRREQPDWNRVVLDVWQPIDVPIDELHALVQTMAPWEPGSGWRR
jgi:hypothetical protein